MTAVTRKGFIDTQIGTFRFCVMDFFGNLHDLPDFLPLILFLRVRTQNVKSSLCVTVVSRFAFKLHSTFTHATFRIVVNRNFGNELIYLSCYLVENQAYRSRHRQDRYKTIIFLQNDYFFVCRSCSLLLKIGSQVRRKTVQKLDFSYLMFCWSQIYRLECRFRLSLGYCIITFKLGLQKIVKIPSKARFTSRYAYGKLFCPTGSIQTVFRLSRIRRKDLCPK